MKRLNIPPLGLIEGGQLWVQPLQQPAPGANLFFTVPDQFALGFVSLAMIVATSAAVANRVPFLTFNYSGVEIGAAMTTSSIAAGQTVIVDFNNRGPTSTLINSRLSIGAGRLIIPPGGQLIVALQLIDVADQIRNVTLCGIAYPI